MDMMKLADLLIDKIKRDYREDISLVHIHGSYAYGDTHDRSDLDMYFVPKTPRGFNLGCTFILSGIGCDVWALPWERLERIAAHEEKITAILTEGKAVYFGSPEDEARFSALRQKALDLQTDREKAAESAAEKLAPGYRAWFHMQNASLAEARTQAIDMIYTLSFALSELNGIPVRRGRRHLKGELMAMPLKPRDFEALYDTAFTSDDPREIAAAYGTLLQNTEELIEERRKALGTTVPVREALAGWYEEMIQSYNKIDHACQAGDIYTPLFAGVEYSSELKEILERTGCAPDLPDMAAAYDPRDLGKIASAAREHQTRFERFLEEQAVQVRRFDSFAEVESFLDTL